MLVRNIPIRHLRSPPNFTTDLVIVLRQDPSCAEAERELESLSAALRDVKDEDYDADDAGHTAEEMGMPFPDDPYLDGAEDTPWLSETSDFEHKGNAIPCRFYNHDGCKNGPKCKFSHAPDSRSVRDKL